jgi:hypothetical protein
MMRVHQLLLTPVTNKKAPPREGWRKSLVNMGLGSGYFRSTMRFDRLRFPALIL